MKKFNLHNVPFSTFGAWTSISVPKTKQQIYFRNHHNRGNNLFPLQAVRDGNVVEPTVDQTPWLLTLRYGDAKVEICYESPQTVRMRGQGIGFLLGERELAYRCGLDLFALNKPFSRRYQVEFLRGEGMLHQLVETQPVFPKTLEVLPDKDGGWEIAVDSYQSTWVRPGRMASFDECVATAKERFDTFLAGMPDVREEDRDAHMLATYVNWATAVEPCGLVKRPSLLMSKHWMNNIWSWDHAFNAMALAAGHPDLAMDQMLTMVDHQDEFGCYPDSFNDLDITYSFSKPPVHGWAFSEMLKRMPETPSDEQMQTMYRALGAQADWWMKHRVLEGKHLPYYLHGNDSGWDNSTMFQQGVPLEAPDLAALLVVQMESISEIARMLGLDEDAKTWDQRADELYEQLMAELWLGDHFVARLGITGAPIESKSLVPWLTIMLGKRLPQDVRDCIKRGIQGHLTEWGLATERVDSDKYVPDGYWQGPIWAPSSYIAVSGLIRAGYTELADVVAERFCRLGDKSGFPENYDAVTGAPLRCPSYTWTSSVFILMSERLKAVSGN